MGEKADIIRFKEEMNSQLLNSGASFVGFANISELHIRNNDELKTAISFGIPYDAGVVGRLDSEIDAFEKHVLDTMYRLENLLASCEQYLRQRDFTAWKPPIDKSLPGLMSDFSHKIAATKAGLGWIGRSSLFVSSQFGCGVRLATLITNAPFTPGTPVTESQCGSCFECVNACPYQAIRGTDWYPGIERDELFDAFLCHQKREAYIPELGYKHPYGLCIQACPVGKRSG